MNRIPSKLFSLLLAGGLIMLFGWCGPAVADAESLAATDQTTLVIMAPQGPVLAALQITVDSQPYRLWVTTFLARRMDLNRDGQLTLPELQLIPTRLLNQTQASSPQQVLRSCAADDAAESVAVSEFATWFAEQLDHSFNIIAGSVQPSEAVRLAALIDTDADGAVSVQELRQASHTLRFRDLDIDQTFTAAELMPFRDPRNQQAAVVPDAANLPFVQVTDVDSLNRTARQILQRYGQKQDSANVPATVSAQVVRLPEDRFPQVDTNGDRQLDQAELTAWLASDLHHLRLQVLLSDKPNRSDLKVDIQDAAAEFCSATPGRRGRTRLLLDDMPVEIRARGGGGESRSFLVNFLLQRMTIYDADKNGYLTEDEYPELQQQLAAQLNINAEFDTVDLNHDQMLLREELQTFIEQDAIATQSRIDVSVRQDGKTLFQLLDVNRDRRLTQRELLEGFEVLQPFDQNQDGRLTESELGTEYILEIGLGQAESLRLTSMSANSMSARSTDAILPGVEGLAGPEWFRRMDRNQDRDVSYREFLGPRHIFETLDTDNNGLLSAQEAEQLE